MFADCFAPSHAFDTSESSITMQLINADGETRHQFNFE